MKNKLKQHNAVTGASYEMNALEKNIIYMLLSLLDEADAPDKTYKIALNDLKGARGKDIDHVHFAKTIKKLVNRRIYTQYANKKELVLNILSSGRYDQGTIELEISEEMRAFLFDLKNNFTLFSLQVALNLKSKYSKRLYEMFSQFKDTGKWFITLSELKTRLSLYDKKTGKEKYPTYGLFRTKVLEVAKKELEKHGDLTVTYEAQKTGKRYTHLIFKIKYNKPPQKDAKQNEHVNPGLSGDALKQEDAKQNEHVNPGLSGDALKQYVYMTQEVRWLDKSMAYRVVQTLPTQHLWNCIDKFGMMVKKGGDDRIHPQDFFKQRIEEFLTNPQARPTWSICYNRMLTDFGLSAIVIRRLQGLLEQKTNPANLLDFLGRLSEEMKQQEIPKTQKRSYVKKRLLEAFDLAF